MTLSFGTLYMTRVRLDGGWEYAVKCLACRCGTSHTFADVEIETAYLDVRARWRAEAWSTLAVEQNCPHARAYLIALCDTPWAAED